MRCGIGKIVLIILTVIMLSVFNSCMRDANVPVGGSTDTTDENRYYTVSFDTGVDDIIISDKRVADGKCVSKPIILEYREGYRLVGWSISSERELYDFSAPVKGDLTLSAVWEAEDDGHIYDSHTPVSVIHNGTSGSLELALNIAESLSLTNYMGIRYHSHNEAEAAYHEIVVGKTDREISKAAYAELEKIVNGKEALAYLIYSDGRSLALAYTEAENELALEFLCEIFMDEYIKESLKKESGVCESYFITVDDYYVIYDAEERAAEWSELQKYLTDMIGEDSALDFVSALKELYSLYDKSIVEWLAALYDPSVGGFYYSNSARDNLTVNYNGTIYELLPDAESTYQALNILNSSGITSNYGKDLPEFMREQIVSFITSLQDKNGYFYHPQWKKSFTDSHTSRRSRDLRWSESILAAFGAQPLYTTPNGVVGSTVKPASCLTPPLGRSHSSAVSFVTGTAEIVNSNLKDRESFEKYLARLDIANRSYNVGSELTTQTSEILERDRQLAKEGADYSLMEILIEWLNENQHPETGHWHTSSDYYAVNGILKITGIYNAAGVPIPNAEATARSAIAAITSDEEMSAVVDLYNTWSAVNNVVKNLRNYGGESSEELADEIVRELLLSAPDAIRKSKEKIEAFKKPDGSFSYSKDYSSKTSMGMPVAIPNSYEGDVNATYLSVTGLFGNIMGALELGAYKPAIFGVTEFRTFIKIVESKM